MRTITVRNLPDEVHRALRVRAAMHSRSTEAEIRAILEAVAQPPERLRIGSALAELGRQAGLTDAELTQARQARVRLPAEPLDLT
ncbi:MAG: plasmid stability protein [Gallionella sp.]|nr:plasmid stability protein [Gallionella sp.]MDD4947012.1 plasmid stability protein [Gallionella sp.]